MQAAAEIFQKETALADVWERRRWNRAAKSQKKRADMRSEGNVTVAHETINHEAAAATSGHKGSVVVFEDSVVPTLEAAAGAMPTDVRSVHVAADVESQRSTWDADARQEEDVEVADVAPGLGEPVVLSRADAAAVATLAQGVDDETARVEEIIEKLNTENLALHGQLVAKKLLHARTLSNNVRLQRDMKKVMKEKEQDARLMI